MAERRQRRNGDAIPEFIQGHRGHGWTIIEEESQPRASINERLMFVPKGDSPQAANVRAHEMGHAKWSPVAPNHDALGVRAEVLQAAEDARINMNLTHGAGVDLSDGFITADEMAAAVTGLIVKYQTDPAAAVTKAILASVAACGTGDRDRLLHQLEAQGAPLEMKRAAEKYSGKVMACHEQARVYQGATAQYLHTEQMAKWLDKIINLVTEFKDEPEPEGKGDDDGEGEGEDGGSKRKRKGDGDEDEGEPKEGHGRDEASDRDKDESDAFEAMGNDPSQGNGGKWGRMIHVTPPRTVRVIEKLHGRRYGPRDMGNRLKYMTRWTSDRKIFATKKKRPGGGTILEDASGSMRTSEKDLDEMIELSPAGTFAFYSGTRAEGGHGELVITAKDGKRVPNPSRYRKYGGNVIDLPALKWLATQPEPRIWVSDGLVTGTNENSSIDLALQCLKFRRQHRIMRLPSLEVAKAFFKWKRGVGSYEEYEKLRRKAVDRERNGSYGDYRG